MNDATLKPQPPRVISLEATGSTNEDALERGRAGDRGHLWIRADRQVKGRGRAGRDWASPPGNLYATLLLRDPCAMQHLPQLAHVSAVALVEAVREAAGDLDGLRIKWPNDLVCNQRKVAGILLESGRASDGALVCVAGFGVNCVSHPDGLAYATTSLSVEASHPVEADAMFRALVAAMGRTLDLWRGGAGFPAIRDRWLNSALPKGTSLRASSHGRSVTGTFDGIDESGCLLLQTPSGRARVEAADVFFDDRSAVAHG